MQDDESRISIAFEGEGKGTVPLDETNFLWQAFAHVVAKERQSIPTNAAFIFSIHNDIPLGTIFDPRTHVALLISSASGRGLGSSGAAVVCGVIIANQLFDLGLDTDEVLRYCVAIEGHPDNASASLCGGFTVCCGYNGGKQEARFDGSFDHLIAVARQGRP